MVQRAINGEYFAQQSSQVGGSKKSTLVGPNQPAAIVNAKTESLSSDLAKLTKQLRQFPSVGGEGGEVDEEEGDLVTGPVEQWLKQMIKGSPSTPKPQTKRETKQESSSPSTSPTVVSVPKGKRQRLTRKQIQQELPFHGSIDTPGSSAQDRIERLTKEYKKTARARAVKRFKHLPRREDWAQGKKLRRKLSYDEYK